MLHLDAGRYGPFLWPAYGISALVLSAVVLESLVRARTWRRRASEEARRAERESGR